MILDELIEKKDVLAWIDFRCRELALDKKKAIKTADKRQKENVNRMFIGRYRELKRLELIILSNGLKDDSKRAYRKTIKEKDDEK